MERKHKDVKKTEFKVPTKPTSGREEHGQFDDIIGGFGKYQLLIFLFKILIGLVMIFVSI